MLRYCHDTVFYIQKTSFDFEKYSLEEELWKLFQCKRKEGGICPDKNLVAFFVDGEGGSLRKDWIGVSGNECAFLVPNKETLMPLIKSIHIGDSGV